MKPRTREESQALLAKLREEGLRKYGHKSVSLGSEHHSIEVVPTASLMLDYKTGLGGFPYGHGVEVYGDNTLGKTAAIAYGVLANVQKQGRLAALIAAEPIFDPTWAEQHGVDTDLLLIKRPENAEEAFEMLHDMVYSDLIDYIVFDSVGGLGSKSETEKGTKKAYGISGVVTSGLNSVMPRLWKSNTGLLLINQQRQENAGNTIAYESPGGEALKHHMAIRIQLKPGQNRYTVKRDKEEVLVGRELVCVFKKNKLRYNMKAARFDFFYQATSEYGPVGVDRADDVIRTGKVSGALKVSGAWIEHPAIGKVQGAPALRKKLDENPAAIEAIRQDILAKMEEEQERLRKEDEARKLRLVSGGQAGNE